MAIGVGNPIQYVSRTFNTMMADLNADPTLQDKPAWVKRIFSGMMDVWSAIENLSANETFLRTAVTRKAVADHCAAIDYFPAGRTPSSGTLMFDVSPSLALPYTIAQGDLCALYPGSVAIPAMRFEARAPLVVNMLSDAEPAAQWNATSDQVTTASNTQNYTTGEKVRLSTLGTLPAGLSAGTDYYVVVVSLGASPAANVIQLASSRTNAFAGSVINFTTAGTGTHTITRLSRAVTCYQQTTVAQYQLGTSDGVSAWQEFRVAQAGVISQTLVVTVNGVAWTQVSTPVYNLGTDQVYRLLPNSDDSVTVRFGDGTYGAVPGAYPVMAAYAWGGGLSSDVAGLNAITSYAGTDQNVTGVFNATPMAGGADAEPVETSKILAPLLLKARDRFVTAGDGQALVLAYGGISQCQVNPNVYGVLSAQVLGVASGSQIAPSSGVRAAVAAMLVAKTLLNEVNVQFDAGTFTGVNLSANVHLMPGYSWAAVQPYALLAVDLFLSPAGNEVMTDYSSTGGLAAAVTAINAIFGTSFSTSDQQVGALLDAMKSGQFPVQQFGNLFELSTLVAFVAGFVQGVSYFNVTQVFSTASPPATFSYQCALAEILKPGTVTLTQV